MVRPGCQGGCCCAGTVLVAGWLPIRSCVLLAAETIAKIRTATKANMAKKAVQDKLRSAALGKSHSDESRVSFIINVVNSFSRSERL